MTSLIRLRKQCPEIGTADWNIIPVKQEQLLVMRYNGSNHSLIIIHNFSEQPTELELSVKQAGNSRLVDLINKHETNAAVNNRHIISLEAYGYRWLQSGDPAYV